MRLPFVRRSRLDSERARRTELARMYEEQFEELLYRVERAKLDRRAAIEGAAAANRREEQAIADCAKLITDLRVVSARIEPRTNPYDQRITAFLTFRSEMLLHAFKSDGTFVRAIAYHIEDLLRREPELMRSVFDWPNETRELGQGR